MGQRGTTENFVVSHFLFRSTIFANNENTNQNFFQNKIKLREDKNGDLKIPIPCK